MSSTAADGGLMWLLALNVFCSAATLETGGVNRVAGLPSRVIWRWANASVAAPNSATAATRASAGPAFVLLDCIVPPRTTRTRALIRVMYITKPTRRRSTERRRTNPCIEWDSRPPPRTARRRVRGRQPSRRRLPHPARARREESITPGGARTVHFRTSRRGGGDRVAPVITDALLAAPRARAYNRHRARGAALRAPAAQVGPIGGHRRCGDDSRLPWPCARCSCSTRRRRRNPDGPVCPPRI